MAIEGAKNLFSNGLAHAGSLVCSGWRNYSRFVGEQHPQAAKIAIIAVMACNIAAFLEIKYYPSPSPPHNPFPLSPPQNPVRYSNELLNKSLHNLAAKADVEACRSLIAKNADPNALDSEGRNSLRIAIINKQWNVCKVLLDNGANWTYDDRERIKEYFTGQKARLHNLDFFLCPFPHPGTLEMWDGNKFQPLSRIPPDQMPTKASRIAFMYVFNEEINQFYGAISQGFVGDLDPLYRNIAQYFPLIRVAVETGEDMVYSAIEVEQLQFPTGVLMFHGHGNSKQINSNRMSLKATDKMLSRIIAKLTRTSSANDLDIVMYACRIAEGEEHFVQKLSRAIPGSIVYGSSRPPHKIDATFYRHPSGQMRILPIFTHRPEEPLSSPIKDTRAYRNGSEIALGDLMETPQKKMIQVFDPQAIPSDEDVFIKRAVTNFRHWQAVAIMLSAFVLNAII